ncbi:MAG: hypothetical protein JNM20_12305 [Rhizobiales bacterium]|nr:hypothetical protein [Hyphomicrobiales bacterium]
MNPNIVTHHVPPALPIHAALAESLRGFCAQWRRRRQCEARAREIETVLREMDPRLHRDIGFELMASRRSYDGAIHSHALIQAVSIAFADAPNDTA